ncbi:MAG: four helix bundle protein [Thermoanaerobaculaceae bacterium]
MSTTIRDFEDLKVWQRAMGLARHVYELTAHLPAAERMLWVLAERLG